MTVATAEKPKAKDVTSTEVLSGVKVALYMGNEPIELPKPLQFKSVTAFDLDQTGICEGVVRMELRVENPRVWAFNADGNKNVVLKRDKRNEIDPGFDGRIYQQGIQVGQNDAHVLYTMYNTNNIRLIEIAKNGEFKTYEVSLVSHGAGNSGKFWLACQQIYADQVVNSTQGERVCPGFDQKWPQFVSMLRQLTGDTKTFSIGSIDDYKAPVMPKYRPKAGEGKVLWFNIAQGYGAVFTGQGSARVYWSEITGRELAYLMSGEKVAFQKIGPPLNVSDRGTGFKWEVTGVQIAGK